MTTFEPLGAIAARLAEKLTPRERIEAIAAKYAGVRYIACIGDAARNYRIAVDLECVPTDSHILRIDNDVLIRRQLCGRRGKVAAYRMGGLTLDMEDALAALEIPELTVTEARVLQKLLIVDQVVGEHRRG